MLLLTTSNIQPMNLHCTNMAISQHLLWRIEISDELIVWVQVIPRAMMVNCLTWQKWGRISFTFSLFRFFLMDRIVTFPSISQCHFIFTFRNLKYRNEWTYNSNGPLVDLEDVFNSFQEKTCSPPTHSCTLQFSFRHYKGNRSNLQFGWSFNSEAT